MRALVADIYFQAMNMLNSTLGRPTSPIYGTPSGYIPETRHPLLQAQILPTSGRSFGGVWQVQPWCWVEFGVVGFRDQDSGSKKWNFKRRSLNVKKRPSHAFCICPSLEVLCSPLARQLIFQESGVVQVDHVCCLCGF